MNTRDILVAWRILKQQIWEGDKRAQSKKIPYKKNEKIQHRNLDKKKWVG
jgi:hypothetical protein